MDNNSNMNEPKPPADLNRTPHHHYLHVYDNGNFVKEIILQWDPSAQRWSPSGEVGTGTYVDTSNMRYAALCIPCQYYKEVNK